MRAPPLDPAVQSLLAAVRRRLWRERLLGNLRGALWASAALAGLAAGLRLLTGWPGVVPLAAAAVLPWLVALGAWLAQRPTPSQCALFADRELRGESAYSTLLEARGAAGRSESREALRWLERWTRQAASGSRRMLAARHVPARVARPLAVLAVCAALYATAALLPATDRPAPAAAGPGGGATPAAPAEVLHADGDALAERLAAALRSPVRPDAANRGTMADAAASAADQAAGAPPDARDGPVAPAGGELARGPSDAGLTVARSSAAAGVETGPGAGGGREAGAARDTGAAAAGPRAAPGAAAVQWQEVAGSPVATQRRANMDQLGSYLDDAAPGASGGGPLPAPRPAVPPPARHEAALSPAEAAYVQAWQTARGARR